MQIEHDTEEHELEVGAGASTTWFTARYRGPIGSGPYRHGRRLF